MHSITSKDRLPFYNSSRANPRSRFARRRAFIFAFLAFLAFLALAAFLFFCGPTGTLLQNPEHFSPMAGYAPPAAHDVSAGVCTDDACVLPASARKIIKL
ncbi:hypothetical protein G7K_6158-t1 [Saitoella complicata NRRL Y-17804]|uniref:Uncharacterized protein n=1 Tax=Saitoella complicata (strain BCRC 22490 / CBS 7301 / JCM 7358 / NBRC 10748 / NRRL Y-17804) TaxID=698492 RepID=A0A0E9NQB8_SAICN|nr:hypothetical protein G7K_6158-t1 [Saitoella complicata NRRL Y-17804]